MSIKPSGVLPSKLNVPLLTSFHLSRERLGKQLTDAQATRAIVLRAPAGFGKTTVMLQHASAATAQGKTIAWLNLDAADNDIDRFLVHLERAVTPAAAPLATPGGERGVLELIERISASTQPFVLFLDEFEAIQSSAVLDVIRQILEHMPPAWQLVIGSRITPGLGLARLRARGQLVEIGLGQLRFSDEEAHAFLYGQRGLNLSAALITRLQKMTEGWATALWLASVALERHPDPETFLDTFSGSDAAIDAFLAEEVLSKQPQSVREFLMRTSVLKQLSAPVCDAVLDRNDSAHVLAQLDQAGVFLIALDQAGHYRYHSLFADFLGLRLAREAPSASRRLHLRASSWYETAGWPVAAIEHALAAGEHVSVTRLLELHAEKLLDVGRFRLLARWFDRLAPASIDLHPKLRVIHAWALAFSHRVREAADLLEQLDRFAHEHADQWDAELHAHRLALRPVIQIMLDRSEGAALEIAIANHRQLDPAFGFPYSVLTNTLATLQGGLNHYGEARALLDEARRSHFKIGSTFNLVIAECVEGGISLRQGRLQDAISRFRVAMNHMALEPRSRVQGHALAAVLLAEALYESGDAEQAGRLLSVYLPLARELGLGDYLVRGHFTLARLAWHRGEHEQAFQALVELEYHGRQDHLARLIVCAELERSRLALLRGDNLAAVAHLRRAQDTEDAQMDPRRVMPLHDIESVELAQLRLKVCVGQTPSALAEALVEIPACIENARHDECHLLALHLLLLWAEALQRSGQIAEARQRVVEALAQAAPQGLVQPFADEGPVVASLALSCWRTAAGSGRQQQSAFAAFGARLEAACASVALAGMAASATALATPAARTECGLDESLTVREIHVLKLLAQGKSNAAIADGLFVSENTVRTHMRNISAKLGARNRTAVVVRARELGLIA